MMDAAAAQDQPPPQRPRPRIGLGFEFFFITWFLTWSMIVPVMLLFYGVYFVIDQSIGQVPHYSVAIDSVSHLDPVLGGGGPALDLEFNLTVRVASLGFWAHKCAGPGMHAEVSYHGVLLASSAATTEQICAEPRTAVDWPVVARGAGVVVPGPVLDSLAGDMHNGLQVFDVELYGYRKNDSWTCGPRRVGDSCALQMDCP